MFGLDVGGGLEVSTYLRVETYVSRARGLRHVIQDEAASKPSRLTTLNPETPSPITQPTP